MKALVLEENGKIESLKVVFDREKPIPKENEIRVKVCAYGLNPSDYQTALYKGLNDERKRVLGLDVAGGYSIQLAKLCGLTVYTSCAGKDIEYVKNLGADVAIDYKNEDVYEVISKLTNKRGVDYVVNTIGTESATKDLDILAINGEIAVIAGFPDFNRLRFYEKGISIHEIAFGLPFTNGDYKSQCNIAKIGDELAKLLAEKKILSPRITEISLEEVPEYLMKMKEGKITGKIVAKITNM
ncbi:zinc-binding dehydrogenase [Clostridium sp. SHJSY1]|uniref:zinc-binding dehydrogenase n=1 Tax=Clostridium sp. SHJSY1 TaxID=2942483 RepID=UPI00287665AF|nr:zinc-binding dehydrogenase [Clostridium sp. SHJSY1]MDS0527427.1 zinc-binding dehydrogenase [Clostridium sp. SHJSY1]